MTSKQKALVQETFAQVIPISEDAATMFYARLFEKAPALRSLFKRDMREQGRKLMQMIGYSVARLDALDDLVPAVKDLGRRHAEYGVSEADYATVGEALLWTLERGLGAAFTPDVRDAWQSAYGLLSSAMITGAADSPASRPERVTG